MPIEKLLHEDETVWYFTLNRPLPPNFPYRRRAQELAREVFGQQSETYGLLEIGEPTYLHITFKFGEETPFALIREFATLLENEIP